LTKVISAWKYGIKSKNFPLLAIIGVEGWFAKSLGSKQVIDNNELLNTRNIGPLIAFTRRAGGSDARLGMMEGKRTFDPPIRLQRLLEA